MRLLAMYFSSKNYYLVFTKYILGLILTFLCVSNAYADSVHLGLKIHYKTAMSHVEKKDLPVIEMLRRISVALPEAKFLIAGHTDIVGSYDINVELSKGRANTVKLLMVYNGVPESIIETKWFSYDAPIASNDTEEGRAQNRRTVATIYNLTPRQAQQLVKAANKSKRFYVIKTESEKVDGYIAEVLEPEIVPPTPPLPPEPTVEESVVEHAEQQAEEEDIVAIPEDVVTKDSLDQEVTEDNDFENEDFGDEEETTEIVETKAPKEPRVPSDRHRYYVGWALTDNELVADRPGFKAIWVTDFNHDISLAYQYKVSKKYWLGASGVYRFQDYRMVNNPIFTWDEVTPNLMKLAVNLDYEPEKNWTLGFDVNYSEENFVLSQGLDVYLQKAGVFGISGRGLYRFYDTSSMSSRVKATVELPLFSSDSIEPKGRYGLLIGADLSFKKLFKSHEVNVGGFFGIRSFENIQYSQTETLAGFEIKIRNKRWP